MRGPIDYVVVGFKGPRFDGKVLEQLGAALDAGIIGLVSLAVVYKNRAGDVAELDIQDTHDRYLINYSEHYNQNADLLDDDDVSEVGELLENDTAAAILVIEHLWAKPLKQSILEAGGALLAEGRIHPEAERELSRMEA
jgi:hypothetical protein